MEPSQGKTALLGVPECMFFEIIATGAQNLPARLPGQFSQHRQNLLSCLAGGFNTPYAKISKNTHSGTLKFEIVTLIPYKYNRINDTLVEVTAQAWMNLGG